MILRCKFVLWPLAVSALLSPILLAHPAAAAPPATPTSLNALPDTESANRWTVEKLTEIRRIDSIAIRGATRVTAYIVKTPSLSDGKNLYSLYVVDPTKSEVPRRVVQADYLRDLASRPNSGEWSFRGDLGEGVQLYQVDDQGNIVPLVEVNPTVPIGSNEGLRRDQLEGLRQVGVISYEWSPDGSALWYSRARLAAPAATRATYDAGVVYDDTKMDTLAPYAWRREAELAGTELRVLSTASKVDSLLVFSPTSPLDLDLFRRDIATTLWVGNSTIQYRQSEIDSSGALLEPVWRINIVSGARERVVPDVGNYGYSPTRDGNFLTVEDHGGVRRLISVDVTGKRGMSLGDFGRRRFELTGGAWSSPSSNSTILSVRSDKAYGLAAFPEGALSRTLDATQDDLEKCAFNADLTYGACSRENLTIAPALVSIDVRTGEINTLADPNTKYKQIPVLRTEAREWWNKFGNRSNGYVTFPRGYESGKKYPAIIVTHYTSARNQFAFEGFQWEFPIQVFAERGYFVVSVNEPPADLTKGQLYADAPGQAAVDDLQFKDGVNPGATLEAAAQSLVDSGDVDPTEIGIAGYSRGAEDVIYVICHSHLFKAASIGDDAGRTAGSFWTSKYARTAYTNLFGGSPFEPTAVRNYQAFSISFRAADVAGPVLQQFTGSAAAGGMELDGLLKTKRIPTELVVYPDEAHIFYEPRHRASAMERNLDWFDYWLRGVEAAGPGKGVQYARWHHMMADWKSGLNKPSDRVER